MTDVLLDPLTVASLHAVTTAIIEQWLVAGSRLLSCCKRPKFMQTLRERLPLTVRTRN